MALKNIENTGTDSKSSPKRRNPGVKTKSKGRLHPKKEKKEEYSKEELRRLGFKF